MAGRSEESSFMSARLLDESELRELLFQLRLARFCELVSAEKVSQLLVARVLGMSGESVEALGCDLASLRVDRTLPE